MRQVILTQNEKGGVVVVYPMYDCGIPVAEIARKDVPAGSPYLIVDATAVPSDHTFFDAFEADFSNPHGYGIGQQSWFIEKYTAEIAALDPTRDAEHIAYLERLIAVQRAEMQS